MSGKRFVTNRSAGAGATRSGPRRRPQASTTAVTATRPAAARLSQKAVLTGRVSAAAGSTTAATTSASRQLDHRGVHQAAGRAAAPVAVVTGVGVIRWSTRGPGREARALPGPPLPWRPSLLDLAGFLQELLLEGGDRVEGLLGRFLTRNGLVELLLLLDEEFKELRHVPDVLLPIEARPEGVVPRPEGVVLGGVVDALEGALAAGLGELDLRILREPPLAEVERLPRDFLAVPGGENEGLSADVRPPNDLSVGASEPRHHGEGGSVGDLGRLRRDRRLAEADPLDDPGHRALAEQLVDLEDVHGPRLHHRGHVLGQCEVVLERLDRGVGVDDSDRVGAGHSRLVPDVGAVLPDEAVDLHGREVVTLPGLVGDPVEIVGERLTGQLVARLPPVELADVAHHRPVGVVHLLGCAGQLVAVPGPERPLLRGVAEDVLSVVDDQKVRHLREPV